MNIFVFHGNNTFAIKKAKSVIINQYIEQKFNITSFSLSSELTKPDSTLNHIRQKIIGQSLFASEKELVSITVILPEKAQKRKKVSLTKNKIPVLEILASYLADWKNNVDLIIEVPTELEKSSVFLGTVKKAKGEINLINLPPIKDKKVLFDESRKFLNDNKVNPDSYFLQKVVEKSNGDWWQVFSILEQWILLEHSTDSKSKLQNDLNELLDIKEEKNIFKLFDAISDGDRVKSLTIIYETGNANRLNSGKDIEQTLGFISLMARQIKQLIAIKSVESPSEAQKDWQIPSFAYAKIRRQASNFSLEFLEAAYSKLVELQEKAKRGLYSPLSLIDFYILYIISHRKAS